MIVLAHKATGKPVAVFTDVDAMRVWLRARGPGSGWFYTRTTVELDPK